MRFAAAALCWLLTTVAVAVALPTAWVQRNVVDADGYGRLTQHAAADPGLQAAVGAELSTQAVRLIREQGYDVDDVGAASVRDAAGAYTAGAAFPAQFVEVNRSVHDWLFIGGADSWVIDVAPMLRDSAFRQLLADYDLRPPSTVTVPLTVSHLESVRPGGLRPVAVWGPWVSLGLAALAGVCAALTLAAARRRGRALAGLGVSALLVGAAGWAGVEMGRRYLNLALNQTTGDIRRIADVVVNLAEDSLHGWLDLALAAGGALVVFGVVVAMVGGLLKP